VDTSKLFFNILIFLQGGKQTNAVMKRDPQT